ncbi:hypothetical protein BFJ72_g14741 [Fusarium proliferatum]|uniref:AA1-like domain-containing protein n=1 Tax=Gibberella intermedia TaxID=948311 RepID=A0A420RYR3_GIBIN|nr:hypothetical protein FPRO03_12171 [Fusarium proliferatum]RKL22151.1 hypothetical protein BFJ72_g14741 [Fusarium proliferatum]
MFAPLMMLSILVPGTFAASSQHARCHSNKLPASITVAHVDRNNKNDISFRLYTDGMTTRCPPLTKHTSHNAPQALKPRKVYECANPDATFSYDSHDGKLKIWVANDNGFFGGSVIVSDLAPEVISVNLDCLSS